MNCDSEKLSALLKRLRTPGAAPLSPDEEQWLADFKSRYPFFNIPAAAGGPTLLEAVTAPAPEALARLKDEPEASRFDGFYPPEKRQETPSTDAAIEDFLNTYGHQSQEEDELLERLIFNPVPDYAQQLAIEEENSLPGSDDNPAGDSASVDPDSPQARINRFILSHRPSAVSSPPSSQSPAPSGEQADATKIVNTKTANPPARPQTAAPPDGLLSESLAKIYIKTHRYERAYEILNGLSLRFPEKSSYFADQLRFLQKLILNQRRIQLETKGDLEPSQSESNKNNNQ